MADVTGFFNWLEEKIEESALVELGGIYHLPIETCERQLDYAQHHFEVVWGTRNLRSSLHNAGSDLVCNTTLELVFTYYNAITSVVEEIKRVSGSSTIYRSQQGHNWHLAATGKSLAVVNACMDLGDRFGRFLSTLNRDSAPVITEKQRPKQFPDDKIVNKYLVAVSSGDMATVDSLKEIYEFNSLQKDA